MEESQLLSQDRSSVEVHYQKILTHVDQARNNVQRTIDTEMVKTYWLIGRDIVEEEQKGQQRAEYGKSVLETLSKKLKEKYQRGFSVDTWSKHVVFI